MGLLSFEFRALKRMSGHGLNHGNQLFTQSGRRHHFQLFNLCGILDAKLPNSCSTELIQMTTTTEFFPEVVRNCAHIGTLTRAHEKGEFG